MGTMEHFIFLHVPVIIAVQELFHAIKPWKNSERYLRYVAETLV